VISGGKRGWEGEGEGGGGRSVASIPGPYIRRGEEGEGGALLQPLRREIGDNCSDTVERKNSEGDRGGGAREQGRERDGNGRGERINSAGGGSGREEERCVASRRQSDNDKEAHGRRRGRQSTRRRRKSEKVEEAKGGGGRRARRAGSSGGRKAEGRTREGTS